jgi:Subtilase family
MGLMESEQCVPLKWLKGGIMAECPLPPASIIALADDVEPEQVDAIKTDIAETLHVEGLAAREKSGRGIISYPLLRALVIPLPATDLRQAIPIGTHRVIAIDEERISRATPDRLPPRFAWWRRRAAADPLEDTKVSKCKCSGAGKSIVVLDVGFYADHPDFKARNPPVTVIQFGSMPPSFAPEHGTRSVGLVGGPLHPSDKGKRYGVAYAAGITFGCVLSKAGVGDCDLLHGLQYAIQSRATVVNMSLGATVEQGDMYSSSFEIMAKRALQAGVLPIAAAGNNGSGTAIAVEHPANCPSVLAVGALDGNLQHLPESAVRLNCDGEVDLVAPGFLIRSASSDPPYYDRKTGTSAAAALVSGIAALWAEKKRLSGCDLWDVLVDHAIPVKRGSRPTTGAGMVQAPA